jgi:hypothetical protein
VILECPNCLAIFGIDEIEDERCAACGWPNVNEDNYPDPDNESAADEPENDDYADVYIDPDEYEDDFDDISFGFN